jgi:polar amino acid transport system substrate-binding protein
LVNAAAIVAGVKLKTEQTGAFDGIIPGVVSGRYEMAASDLGVTEERIKVIDIVSYADFGNGFATKSDSTIAIDTELDVCGLRVTVTAGMTFIPLLESLSKRCEARGKSAIDIQIYPKESDGVLAVKNGRADALAGSQDQVAYLTQQDVGMKFHKAVLAATPVGVGFPKDSPLTKVFQAAFVEMIKNGIYAKIFEKWGLSEVVWTDPENVKINNPKPATAR